MKEPPSPMTSSSSEAESSAPRRYVRCATWTPLRKDPISSMLQILARAQSENYLEDWLGYWLCSLHIA